MTQLQEIGKCGFRMRVSVRNCLCRENESPGSGYLRKQMCYVRSLRYELQCEDALRLLVSHRCKGRKVGTPG